MKLIVLNHPDGTKLYVNIDSIRLFGANDNGGSFINIGTAAVLNVKDSPEDIFNIMNTNTHLHR